MKRKLCEEIIQSKFDELASIINRGDSDELRRVFETGQLTDINEPKVLSGSTLLMIACKSGFIDCVKVLLDYKADLNHPDQHDSLLSCVCASGNVEMVRFIIASGFKISDEAIMNVFKTNDLMINTEVVSILVEYIVNINYVSNEDIIADFHSTYMSWASRTGNVGIVHSLLERGADVHEKDLMIASNNGHLEAMKVFLDLEFADKRLSSERLLSVLTHVSYCGHLHIVRYFFENWILDGSDLTSALTTAALSNQVDVIEYLLDLASRKGDKYIIPISDKSRVFFRACRENFIDMVRVLLRYGTDPNTADTNGFFPIEIALLYPGIVEILLEAGANPNIHFTNGRTPLFEICVSGHEVALEVTALLLRYGADPNLAHEDAGVTPLMPAAYEMHIDLLRLLLEHVADVTHVCNAGFSILDIIGSDPRYTEVVELCMQYMRPILK